MAEIDARYNIHLRQILNSGYEYEDPNRKGVFRTEIPSVTFRHELDKGFPILTTKKTFFKGAVAELLFFLSGSTDIRDLWRRKVNFWDKDWARFQGHSPTTIDYLKLHAQLPNNKWRKDENLDYDMGRIYPAQYRDWTNFKGNNGNALYYENIDQFANVVKTLWKNPMSTSMIVNAWNPSDLNNMALPPCHYGFQIVGRPLNDTEKIQTALENGARMGEFSYLKADDNEGFDKVLLEYNVPKYGFEIHWQQRSTDYFLGTPINIQYYALLAELLEIITGHKALAVQGDLKNVHLYDNQIEQGKELIDRDVTKYENSNLILSDYLKRVKSEKHYDGTNLDEILGGIKVEDFKLDSYESYPRLKAEMLTYDK